MSAFFVASDIFKEGFANPMKVQKPDKNIHFPSVEKEILEKWEQEKTFEETVSSRSKNNHYNFYDGPPFATGLPHFGHFIPSSIKDAFSRYFTMKGYRVERRFGWDCHGVPVELLVQKELGLQGKKDIEAYGIAQFNAACRAVVLRYTNEWREYMKKLGRFVDMDNAYRTMDPDFMESVWYVLKQLWDKNFVYEGKFVVSYSSALGTTLSNFEASLDYRDIQDPSLTVKFKLRDNHFGRSLLVWTTTPWTLIANCAVAINPSEIYVHVHEEKSGEEFYILKTRLDEYWKDRTTYKIIREFLGSELAGCAYEPLFDNWLAHANQNCFKIYPANFVLTDTGTGAVHMAPAFGEDDFKLAQAINLPIIDHLDANGHFLEQNPPDIAGLFFKDGDKPIIANLKKRGLVFLHETFVHSYPHCYRSGTPLIYRAMPSWFVKVEENRELFLNLNSQIHWVPEHVQNGRFGKWLENARDWNIARSRYWGNPIPIWKNDETGETVCLGSIAELQAHTSKKITDLHLEFIDDIIIPSTKYPGTVLKRVPFVLDCWFESGSMPYAQLHYPFENKENFNFLFPADFICEGLDQTRGWFYTLTVLAALLFEKPAFKNVVVNGLALAEDGRKMSKSLKNYPDPMLTLNEFGADSVRLFLLASTATAGEEVRFSLDGVKESTRRVLIPLWNAYSFFATYASIDEFDPENFSSETHHTQWKNLVSNKTLNELDQWILLKLNATIKTIDQAMQTYHIAKAVPALTEFLDDLNNWYIRRSRRRFWNGEKVAYFVLFRVLVGVSKILSPFAPFSAEYFFQKLLLTTELKKVKSVHLAFTDNYCDLSEDENQLLENVATARRVVELGRNIRVAHKIKNRQPLAKITLGVLNPQLAEQIRCMKSVICDELNVKDVVITTNPESLANIIVKPNFKILGKTLGDRIKILQEKLTHLTHEQKLDALQKKTIFIDDLTLTSEQLLVELRPSGHDLVATTPDFVASLDPTLTDSLKMEGIARELVSMIQKSRKSANFDVEDRIDLKIDTSERLHDAIRNNADYIEDETLSRIVQTLDKPEYEIKFDCEGELVTLSCKRQHV